MKLEALKMLAKAGAVKNARLVPAPMVVGKLNLLVSVNQGVWETVTVEARRGNVRNFATIEAALNVVKGLGLNEVLIVLS